MQTHIQMGNVGWLTTLKIGPTPVASAQSIVTVAGGDSGNALRPATQADTGVHSVVSDAAGNLTIGDRANSYLRRVNAATGVLTTIAGNGATQFSSRAEAGTG